MKLRNTEKFVDILEFDINMGEINRSDINRDSKLETNGFFYEHKSQLFGLGVSDSKIWVIVNGDAYSSEIITTTCLPSNKGKEFCVYKNKEPLCSLQYKPNKPQWNFFTEEEDEDVDSLLLIHNILSSGERKSIFVDNN